jgi:hypothetical protein
MALLEQRPEGPFARGRSYVRCARDAMSASDLSEALAVPAVANDSLAIEIKRRSADVPA